MLLFLNLLMLYSKEHSAELIWEEGLEYDGWYLLLSRLYMG